MSEDIKNVLSERNSIYGDFAGGNKLRCKIMNLIQERYMGIHGNSMPTEAYFAIFDIVNKLTRLAVSPGHADSWLDIEGYSKLFHEFLTKEEDDAD